MRESRSDAEGRRNDHGFAGMLSRVRDVFTANRDSNGEQMVDSCLQPGSRLLRGSILGNVDPWISKAVGEV